MPSVLICVLASRDAEVSATCAHALFALQDAIMTAPFAVTPVMCFVHTLDEALNALWASGHDAALVMDGSVGVDPLFVLKCMQLPDPLVLACHPLVDTDWQRVKDRPVPDESPENWGNTYNVSLAGGIKPHGRVEVADVRDMRCAWVRRSVLEDIVRSHPEIVADDAAHAAFAVPGVFDGRSVSAHARFLGLWGKKPVADVETATVVMGPDAFEGCVGRRQVLR